MNMNCRVGHTRFLAEYVENFLQIFPERLRIHARSHCYDDRGKVLI